MLLIISLSGLQSVGSPMGVAAWHAPRCVSPERTLRHRASFAGDVVVVGRGCTGDDTPRAACAAPHDRPFLLAGGWEGGEGGEGTHRQGPRDDSQLTSWTTDTTERALGAKAHEGGAVLSHLFCGGGLLWLLLSGGRRESVYPPIVRVS